MLIPFAPGGIRSETDRLRVAFDLDGNLQTPLNSDGQAVEFFDRNGKEVLRYERLKVFDATGQVLPAQIKLESGQVILEVDDLKAVYPITIDPTFTQQQKLLGIDPSVNENFGYAVALSNDGNTALVGAPTKDDGGTTDSGAAYVFTRSGSVWSQQAKLQASDRAGSDNFGWSVALSSDGNRAVVGAPFEDDSGTDNGAGYVFTRSGSVWTQQAKLQAGDRATNDRLGVSVAMSGDGNTVVLGAHLEDDSGTTNNGAAYVYFWNGSAWSQQQKLLAGDKASSEQFGYSAALSNDGNTAVVGARFESDSGTTENGAAYVYTRSGSTWTQQQKLLASDKASAYHFGSSAALSSDGNTALIGSVDQSEIPTTVVNGAGYVFTRSGSTWTQQQKLLASDRATGDQLGQSVSLSADGNTALLGALEEDSSGTTNNGAVYMYTRSGSVWTQQQKLLAGDKATDDQFGFAVAISGDGNTALVGANLEDDGYRRLSITLCK